MQKITIDLQNTEAGIQFSTLTQVLAGNNYKGVQPFTLVSFQVLCRMADLLQNRPQIDEYSNYTAGTDVI